MSLPPRPAALNSASNSAPATSPNVSLAVSSQSVGDRDKVMPRIFAACPAAKLISHGRLQFIDDALSQLPKVDYVIDLQAILRSTLQTMCTSIEVSISACLR
jgi:hypothetical protein